MDKIKIVDLEVFGHHGVYQEETFLGQKFLVSVTLFLNTKQAGVTDNLEYSVSYAEVAHFVNEYLTNNTFSLIEAAAEQLAFAILLKYTVEEVTVEIKKPWAPILLPLKTVSIEITRKWNTAYLSIGSNLGDKEANLKKAVQLLGEHEKCKISKISDFIITEPYGNVEQDNFLNGALEVKTLLEPEELLELIAQIENELGRVREIHWGPRTIDLDIILFEQKVIREDNLTIPHVEMQKREFVLKPLAQIAPNAIHPLLCKNVYQLLHELI
ncbi:2-amino-4-hydroxy-6-hydroxymethyldihydropteridine diphosphokinase [Anaeromicropila populeti]|uniref:Bifunctional folate synthesis protein n=1 Tax=Anaeromicropila populeti TaxID=37658 RepID=A0A1I6KS40_9FIRM|nr:2-amino-4-hydroxy-6-hydroxymethyldihydropteridine diphosphokinase [Anaeromicropila populeti]SFR94045.1 dihydroneopterin aldolase / 2-amino-4-hydroxy-6-hydroxymethyldihydropteridine diphosphokinase [Anaeromicropila populeti]